eukprot:scaffold23368_cov71-Skeletonema_dohrnii-CCMP3373.AAC.4
MTSSVRSRLEDVVVAGDRRCDSPVNHLPCPCCVHAYLVLYGLDLDLDLDLDADALRRAFDVVEVFVEVDEAAEPFGYGQNRS